MREVVGCGQLVSLLLRDYYYASLSNGGWIIQLG
jgi:hypothetical protein